MATVYGVVKQSGGYIDVFSELGNGTTFKIYLPTVDDAVERNSTDTEAEGALQGTETILLVEDEAALRSLARNVLQSFGYHVLEATNGAEALALADGSSVIHLLLTDVVMPGISGKVLAQELLGRYRDLKVIYMSGYTGQGVGNSGELQTLGQFLPKPFTREVLARKVRKTLDSRAAAASA